MSLKIFIVLIILSYLVGILISMNILLENRDPSKTLSWMMMFVLLPGLGIIMYVVSGRNIRKHKIFKAKEKNKRIDNRQIFRNFEFAKNIVANQKVRLAQGNLFDESDSPEKKRVVGLLLNLGKFPYTSNNKIECYRDGREKFYSMMEDMKSAHDHIHLEYFIIKDSKIGRQIKDILVAKAKEGVEVKILYDDLACWRFKVHRRFLKDLKKAGVKCAAFLPTKFPLLGGQMNYRNHRKIAVIDGYIGYTGGLNIGDEYVSLYDRFGYWRDSHLRIEGVATHMLQMIFMMDWYLTTGEILDDYKYTPKLDYKGDSQIQIVGTGPDSKWEDIHYAFFSAITQAKKCVYIETPYFIPDESLLKAIKTAALAGVDVRIIFPKTIDHYIVNIASYSYFEEVLRAGGRVFLYEKGFLHAKVVIVDDEIVSVGSSNIDLRSFMLNFEVNAFIYDKKAIEIVKDQFYDDQDESVELDLENFRTRNVAVRLLESVARLFSPLL